MSEGEGAGRDFSPGSSSSKTSRCSRDSSESPSSSLAPGSAAGSEIEPAVEAEPVAGRPTRRGIRDLRWGCFGLGGWANLRKGVCTFSFSFHLCWKQRVCQKKICVSLFFPLSLLWSSVMHSYCLPCWRWGSWCVSRVTADEYRNVRFGGWLYHLAWPWCYVRLWPNPAPGYILFTIWLCRVDSYDNCYKDRYERLSLNQDITRRTPTLLREVFYLWRSWSPSSSCPPACSSSSAQWSRSPSVLVGVLASRSACWTSFSPRSLVCRRPQSWARRWSRGGSGHEIPAGSSDQSRGWESCGPSPRTGGRSRPGRNPPTNGHSSPGCVQISPWSGGERDKISNRAV